MFLTSLYWRQREAQVFPWPRAVCLINAGWRLSWLLGPSTEIQKEAFQSCLAFIFSWIWMFVCWWTSCSSWSFCLDPRWLGLVCTMTARSSLIQKISSYRQRNILSGITYYSAGTQYRLPHENVAYILNHLPWFWALCYLCHRFISLNSRSHSDDWRS